MNNQRTTNFPFEIQELEPEEIVVHKKYFTATNYNAGFVRVGPKGYFMPQKYKQLAAGIYNMPLRETDHFVMSFPRSGTTLTQELVWLVANDLDYERAAATFVIQRFPFLEYSMMFGPAIEKYLREKNSDNEQNLQLLKILIDPGYEVVAGLPSPRFIKTHLPLSLLPPALLDTTRVVYVARDPRDVAVSYFHLHKHFNRLNSTADFKDFWNILIEDKTYWCPLFEHIKEAWNLKNHPNMLFLFYEDHIKDLACGVRRVSKFLGKQFNEQQIEQLCQHLSFDNFKNNSSVNDTFYRQLGFAGDSKGKFVRKGKSGGWRDYFDDEMTKQADRWIADNLRDTDLRFPTVE